MRVCDASPDDMMATRKHSCANTPVAAPGPSQDRCVAVTAVREQYLHEVVGNAVNAPPEQTADANRYSPVVKNLILQAGRVVYREDSGKASRGTLLSGSRTKCSRSSRWRTTFKS